MINFLKNLLIGVILYFPPIYVYIKLKSNSLNLIKRFLIVSFYISASFFIVGNLVPFILTLLDIRLLKQKYNSDYKEYKFNGQDLNKYNIIIYALFTYGMTIILNIIVSNILTKYNITLKQQEIITVMSKMSLEKFLFQIPSAVIFAPILEEFIFRWFLFKKVFKKIFSKKASCVLSSIIFAIVHYNLRAVFVLLFIAIFNCYLIEKKGYWYAVINHSIFNFINVFMLLIEKI